MMGYDGKKGHKGGRLNAAVALAALERSIAYAAERKLPLTLERLAVEMDLDVARIRAMSEAGYEAGRGEGAVCAVLRRARREVEASVIEFALSRGTGAQAHMQYLVQLSDEASDAGDAAVVFLNEDKV